MVRILIVYHTQSGNTEKLALAVKEGARAAGAQVVLKEARDAGLKDLVAADGYCFGTPDYFSYMAGDLKDFFDRTFYPSKGKITARPFVCFVSHGGGGSAVRSIKYMGEHFELKLAAKPLLSEGKPGMADLKKARELGAKLAQAVLA
jgi:multimeric flavodoxin WrbA